MKTFFPILLILNLSNIQGYWYPEPILYKEIKEKEIKSVIGYAFKGKALKLDIILNKILK